MPQDLRIALRDLPIGGKAQVEAGDAKALFVRDADGVRAFQAKCPHYGAPLAKGEICGTKLYCPWHKAVFDIGDGSLVEPPALQGLDRYPVRIEGDIAIATLEPMPRAVPREQAEHTVVIVGAGAAAVAAVTTLRHDGFAGKILMIGPESREPYDRPKLSKNFLAKKTEPKTMLLEPDFCKAHDVTAIKARVVGIDTAARRVTLDDGRVITGDAMLVATGSVAKPLALPGVDLPGVHTLRSLDDAIAISAAAEGAKHAVVIGDGFIGLEAAAFLTKRGLTMTVVAPEPLPLAARFGEAVAKGLKRYHESNGIRFVQGKTARIDGDARAEAVVLESGERLSADVILLAVGARPATAGIEGLATRDDGGLAVDGSLALAPEVYVAGDIAAFPEKHSGLTARIEHWRLAQQHGMHAARAILGAATSFARTPYFWSNQGDKRLDYVGYTKGWDAIIMRGDPDALDFIAFYVKDDRAIAACAIGHNPELIAFLHLLDEGRVPTTADLEGGVALASLIAP